MDILCIIFLCFRKLISLRKLVWQPGRFQLISAKGAVGIRLVLHGGQIFVPMPKQPYVGDPGVVLGLDLGRGSETLPPRRG